jgi:hypothetical protein
MERIYGKKKGMFKIELDRVVKLLKQNKNIEQYIEQSHELVHCLSWRAQLKTYAMFRQGYIGEFSTSEVEKLIMQHVPENTYLLYTEGELICLAVKMVEEFITVFKFKYSHYYKCVEKILISIHDYYGKHYDHTQKEYTTIDGLLTAFLKRYINVQALDVSKFLDVPKVNTYIENEEIHPYDAKFQYEKILEAYHAEKPWYYNFYGKTSDEQIAILEKQAEPKKSSYEIDKYKQIYDDSNCL